MTSTLRGLGGLGKNETLLDVGGWRVSKCSGRPVFIFFIKENWICAMTRHHAEPNNILLTRNLSFDPDVRQCSHRLMIPMHFLWAKFENGRQIDNFRGRNMCIIPKGAH